MMKKALFLLVFLPLAAASFAQEISDKYLYIEGTASKKGHYEFFYTNFRKEAFGAGFIVTESKDEAAYTLKFVITPNIITDEGSRVLPESTLEEEQNVIRIRLIRNSDDFEILFFDFFFDDLDEMYEHTRTMFQNATIYIQSPGGPGETIIVIEGEENTEWKNKWLYFRFSFDYPITLYLLQSTGLIGEIGLYYTGDDGKPSRVSPIENEVMAMPGLTFGLEFQFLNFMSLEVNYQFSLGDTRDNTFLNVAFGSELKFPIKFTTIMFSPYAAFFYPIRISDIFKEFPPFMYGGGVQFCAKGGRQGAFFFDIKYLITLSKHEAVMHNPYLKLPEEDWLYPEPAVIHYKQSILYLGVGYKVGLFNRKK